MSIWMLLGLLSGGYALAEPPPMLAGPAEHVWYNHFRLWSTIDSQSRPLSVGHEIMLDGAQLQRVLQDDRNRKIWRPGKEGSEKTFEMKNSDTQIRVKADGSWTSGFDASGSNCRFAAQQKNSLLVVSDGRVWMFINYVEGFSPTGQPEYQTASGSADVTGLLGDLSTWSFHHYQDEFRSGPMGKIVAVPVVDGTPDPTRDAYAFAAVSPSRGNVRLLGVRLRLEGPAAEWPGRTPSATVFRRVPVVSMNKYTRRFTWIDAGGAAQVGGLIELDHTPPATLVDLRVQARRDALVWEAAASNASVRGALGIVHGRGLYGGVALGYFVDTPYFVLTGGFSGTIGRRDGWVIDTGVGMGSALTAHAGLGRVIRTGRRWDLTLTPRVSLLDVDVITDLNLRFPIYAGINLGIRQAGVRLVGE
ncbi:MAG: hypothetical protein AB8H79_19370 [Myxococcota bacterium]